MALTYNQPRFSQNLLAKYKKCIPSFTINLYDDHWTLNKGPSKFLYTQPVSGLLDEVRALRIPVDFIEIFDMANVPYYEGCMIVESIDHRKPSLDSASNEPECVRVVLQPNGESFYADLCLLNAKHGNTWTDQEVLKVESKILNATCPPLCLEPDINLTRIVNTVIRASTPSDSVVLKRKQAHEPEEDENDKAKRAKLWSQYMHPQKGKPSSQVRSRSMFDILNEIARKDDKGVYTLKWKEPKREAASYPPPQAQPQNNPAFAPPNPASATPSSNPPAATPQEDQKPKPKLKMTIKKQDPVEMPPPPGKAKNKPVVATNPPVSAPSPAPEQRKVIPVPAVSRTPVEASAVATGPSPHPPPQFQPPPPQPSVSPNPPVLQNAAPPVAANSQLKKRGVLKKPEDQPVQPPAHQPHPPNPMDSQAAAWQPPIPSPQYLSQPPPPQKKKPSTQQPQQGSPFHAQTPIPGFPNNSGFPQNAAYKNPAGMVQNPNMTANRSSPMSHNQPLLSRDPLPPHSQSPRPPSQQAHKAPPAPQHQMPHPTHQFNMHLSQNRYNAAMQGQPGHHPQPMAQHPMPQQHHTQPTNAARGAPGQHDPSQGMLHPQMQYPPMPFPYQMHMPGMMNGVRMPGGQGAGGQYMTGQAWRVAAGRGGPPMTTMPMHNAQFQQQQMMAAMNRAQAQQAQAQAQQQQQQAPPQGQGR